MKVNRKESNLKIAFDLPFALNLMYLWHNRCLITRQIVGMKNLVGTLLLVLSTSSAFAYISGIAIQTENSSNMQVYVNGKLYNKNPGKFVRIKSQPGLFHVEVKVFHPYNKAWYLVKKDIRVEKGMEFYYKVVFAKNKQPELREIRRYPVYSPYFLNSSLYNRHPIS